MLFAKLSYCCGLMLKPALLPYSWCLYTYCSRCLQTLQSPVPSETFLLLQSPLSNQLNNKLQSYINQSHMVHQNSLLRTGNRDEMIPVNEQYRGTEEQLKLRQPTQLTASFNCSLSIFFVF